MLNGNAIMTGGNTATTCAIDDTESILDAVERMKAACPPPSVTDIVTSRAIAAGLAKASATAMDFGVRPFSNSWFGVSMPVHVADTEIEAIEIADELRKSGRKPRVYW